jgi:translocation and assembly module TamB
MLDYALLGPSRFDVSVSELPLAAFPVNLPDGATVEGAITAQAGGDYANQRLTANATLDIHKLGLTATFEGDEVAARFDRAFAEVSIVDNRLTGELEFQLSNDTDRVTGELEIADVFDQASPLSGHGSLELNDLGLFSVFYPSLSNPVGKISGSIDVAGSLVAPELVGEIALHDGSFGIQQAGIAVTDVALVLRQDKAGHLALQGAARSGDGHLDIRGETTLNSQSGIRTELSLRGEDFKLVHLPDWQVAASPAIAVVFDEDATRISGELGIPRAKISVHSVPETAARPSPDSVVYREDKPAVTKQRVTHVDVRTNLGDDVSFSGFGLTTGLEGSVHITGSSITPYKGFGRVALREGRYQAYGQNLEIESGELIFNGPLNNPALNIRATRTASDKTVAGIHLTGTPSQLKSRVYSEPALGDAEALSYLLTGRPLASADSEQSDMLNQAAFALGLTTAGSIASRIRNELGFETLGVRGGSEDSEFVAGRRFGNRLFIEYAYGIIDSLGTLLLRYQLSKRLVVESRSGTVRNVDLVYTVKKK